MRILALDIGDQWVGTALSDMLKITARPYKTIGTSTLFDFLTSTLKEQQVDTILVGYPQTLRGTHSQQTEKIIELFNTIKETFSNIQCILIDERFTSQQAARLKKSTSKATKLQQHSVAAALILTTYIDHLEFQKQ